MQWIRGEAVARGKHKDVISSKWHTDEGYRVEPTAGGRFRAFDPAGNQIGLAKGSSASAAKQLCEDHYKQFCTPPSFPERPTLFVGNVPPAENQFGASASPLGEKLEDSYGYDQHAAEANREP